jgi:glycosyltransferase involved in cell wall biosynthesis
MNILLLTDKPPWPGDSGGAIATQSIIRILVDKKINLTILSFNTNKHKGSLSDIPLPIRSKIDIQLINHNTTISYSRLVYNLLLSDKPYNLERFRSTLFEKRLIELLTNKFDIIQFEGIAMNGYFNIVKSYSDAKLIMRSHNVEYTIWEGIASESKRLYRRVYSSILAKRIKRVEMTSLNLYDGLIAISDDDLVKFRKIGIDIKAITLYPTIHQIDSKHPKIKSRGYTIGFIGSLDWEPNLTGLIWFIEKVWPQIRDEYPDIKFQVAGRNPGSIIIRKMKRAGVDYVGSPDLSHLFIDSIDLMIVPLFSGSGLRIKILESLLTGVAVVSTIKGAEGLPNDIARDIRTTDDPIEMYKLIGNCYQQIRSESSDNDQLKERAKQYFGNQAKADHLIRFYNM